MTDRRDFLKTTAVAASVMAFGSTATVFASSAPYVARSPPLRMALV